MGAQLSQAERTMRVHVDGRGARLACVVGHRGMAVAQLEEQLRAVMEQLQERLPGGVDNLRAVALCADGLPEVPLFMSLLPLCGAPPSDDAEPKDTWEEDLLAFQEELGWTGETLDEEEARKTAKLARKKVHSKQRQPKWAQKSVAAGGKSHRRPARKTTPAKQR